MFMQGTRLTRESLDTHLDFISAPKKSADEVQGKCSTPFFLLFHHLHLPMTATQDRLLLVFVHGFRGTDTTFKATNEQTGIGVEICCIDTSACRISQNDSRPLQQVLTSIRLFILATRHQGTTFIKSLLDDTYIG